MTITMVWGDKMKITIDNEEVLCNKDFTINEEMLNTSSVILNNVYPATWEQDKNYVSRFYYPKDYSKCKIFNEIEHPEEKSTAEGTSFSINVDTSKEYQVQTLKGQTSQSGTPTPTSPQPINITTGRQVVSVCEKNMFDKNTANLSVGYFDTSGVFHSGGTSSATQGYIPILPNTNMVLSGSKFTVYCFYDKDKSFIERIVSTKTEYTFNKNAYFMRIQGATSDMNADTIQLEKGTTATTYEEYKGNEYEINLGKNVNDAIIREIFINAGATQCNIYSGNKGTYLWLPEGIYTISTTITQTKYRVACINTLPGTSMATCYQGQNKDNSSSTITIDTTGYQYLIIDATDLTAIQVEKGSTKTSFTPYKTPIYLGEIGNYKDCIFKNTTDNPLYDSNLEEGQWYIHKEIDRVVLNGSENWGYVSNNQVFWLAFTGFKQSGLVCMSNYYEGQTNVTATGLVQNNHITFRDTDVVSNQSMYIKNTSITSANNFKTWLSSHNVEVYYVLNTPTNTLIEDEELINQLNSIELLEGLNNVSISSANLPFVMSLMYNYVPEYTEEDLLFCGVVKNTGNISLNPRYPHYCNLQVLDFKTFLSEGETLDFVIYEKTILEAINQVIGTISEYGFVLGNINILHEDEVIGAYSTKDKTAYDVFNYIADITQSRWTTRMVDENIVAIDFYDPSLMPNGTAINYTQEWFCNNKIIDMSFSYSSRDYRNKQVMLSGEVYANIETTEVIIADGYQTQFNTIDKIGYVSSILLNGNPATIITKEEYNLGYEGDFIYQPGNQYFESVDLISTGAVITIVYFAIIEGREIVLNQEEISRVSNMTDRKGIIARYENRNDATTTSELQAIGQSYLKYKGSPEVSLKIDTLNNIWNIGEKVSFSAPLTELTTEYMVKKKTINYITTQDNIFYTYELSSNFNSETEINYFDNQRSKMMGNIGQGEYISRNIDIGNTANVIFYDLEVEEVELGDNTLQSELQTTLGGGIND